MVSGAKDETSRKLIRVKCVAGKRWLIPYCVQNVNAGFTEDARKGKS